MACFHARQPLPRPTLKSMSTAPVEGKKEKENHTGCEHSVNQERGATLGLGIDDHTPPAHLS